jgi:hypothetical protein
VREALKRTEDKIFLIRQTLQGEEEAICRGVQYILENSPPPHPGGMSANVIGGKKKKDEMKILRRI